MDLIQLFAQEQPRDITTVDSAGYVEIDIYKDSPIKMTKAIQELEDISANVSNHTQTFRVPNSAVNGRYFKSTFNVNSQDYDATKKSRAYININGTYFTSGNIRLTNIIVNESTKNIEYEIIFMGETGSFSGIIGPKKLTDLNFSEYRHPINYQNVTDSWTNNLFNGDLVYPLAEWGYTYDSNKQPIQSTVSVYGGTASVKGFTNSDNYLDLKQFKPMIKAKTVWDKIFEDSGFTYESEFIDGFFSSMYLMAASIASPFSIDDLGATINGATFENARIEHTTSMPSKIYFPNPTYDPSNSFDKTTSLYTAPVTAPGYIFRVELQIIAYVYDSYIGTPAWDGIQFNLTSNGTVIQTIVGAINLATAGNTIYGPNQVPYIEFTTALNLGDEVGIEMDYLWEEVKSIRLISGSLKISGPEVMGPSSFLPSDYYQLDFIKSINTKFKLIWEPDPNRLGHFIIEPWKDWITLGSQVDWTSKIDLTKDIKLTPLFQTQKREVSFSDSPDDDVFNVQYKYEHKEKFGELLTDSNIEVIKGNTKITSNFSTIPLAPIGLGTDFLVPHFATDSKDGRQPMKVKPMLVFYNGVQTSAYTWYMEGATGGPVLKTTYPLISTFDRYPFDETAFDLNFKNCPQFWDDDYVGFDGRTAKTAFSEYWGKWYDSMYDPYSRKMEATFSLKYKDIANLRFNDMIFIKDSYWIPIKLDSFDMSSMQSVKVTLVKLGILGTTIVTDSGTYVKTFPQNGLCYSATEVSDACCCINPGTKNLYSDNINFNTSLFFYKDQAGNVPADAGYYSDGTEAIYVLANGSGDTLSTCAACTGFTPTLFYTAYSTTLDEVCCATLYPVEIYGDGTTLDNSTSLYADAASTTGISGGFYRGATSDVVHVPGLTGTTEYPITVSFIDYKTTCANINCDPLSIKRLASFTGVTGTAGYGPTGAACCPYSVDDPTYFKDIYYDYPHVFTNPGYTGGFFYDEYGLIEVGSTGDSNLTFFSDGRAVREVASESWLDDCEADKCINKNRSVGITLIDNGTATPPLITFLYESFDGGRDFFYSGESDVDYQVLKIVDYTYGAVGIWTASDVSAYIFTVETFLGGASISVDVLVPEIEDVSANVISTYFGPIANDDFSIVITVTDA